MLVFKFDPENIEILEIIRTDTSDDLYSALNTFRTEMYSEIIRDHFCEAVAVYNKNYFLNANMDGKYIAAYDPYWDVFVFDFKQIQTFEQFEKILKKELKYQSNFHELLKTHSFKDALKLLNDL